MSFLFNKAFIVIVMSLLLSPVLNAKKSYIFQYLHDASDEIDKIPAEILKLIPKNYNALSATFGDLNKDKFKNDVLVSLAHKKERDDDENLEAYPRALMLLLRQKNGRLKRVYIAIGVLACWKCDIDLEGNDRILIKNGYFTIESRYGFSKIGVGFNYKTRYTTFKYSRKLKTWLLYQKSVASESGNYRGTEPVIRKKSLIKLTSKDFGVVRLSGYMSTKEYRISGKHPIEFYVKK